MASQSTRPKRTQQGHTQWAESTHTRSTQGVQTNPQHRACKQHALLGD